MRVSTSIAIFVSALFVVLTAEPGWAQKWEFGAGGGGSFYKSQSVTNAAASGSAGFSKGFVASAYLGQNMYRHLSGEIRYTYGRNDLELSSGGAKVNFGGQSHAIGYEFLIHSAPVGAKLRPFVAFGGGVKVYQGTGTETIYQNLSNLALLTKTQEWKGLVSFGGGVKCQVSKRALLRVEVRDYFTQFPTAVIAPNRGSNLGGWIHNIVPMVSLAIQL
jgi:hypothetical protein